MAKRAYIGAGGIARKCRKLYIGVNGVARKVKKGYIGVNGVARPFFSASGPQDILPPLSTARQALCAAANTAYALFAGGDTDGTKGGCNIIDAYDVDYVQTTLSGKMSGTNGAQAVSFGQYAYIGSGDGGASESAWDAALTRHSVQNSSAQYAYYALGTFAGYVIRMGGAYAGSKTRSGYRISASLTVVQIYQTIYRANQLIASNDTHLIVAGGFDDDNDLMDAAYAYNEDFSRTDLDALSSGKSNGGYKRGGVGCGKYCLFPMSASVTDVYDDTLTKTTMGGTAANAGHDAVYNGVMYMIGGLWGGNRVFAIDAETLTITEKEHITKSMQFWAMTPFGGGKVLLGGGGTSERVPTDYVESYALEVE